MYEESSVELAKEFVRIIPGDFTKKTAYGLSGSDTIDGAIKFARRCTGRSGIITFRTAYHGALSGSAISLNMRRRIGPMLPSFLHFSYPQCAKCAWREKPEGCSLPCIEEIKAAFSLYLPPDEVATVIIEPIGGDIGLAVPSARSAANTAFFSSQTS